MEIIKLLDTYNRLELRSKMVIDMRHGWLYGREHTLEEIGQTLGLTRQRVQQIEAEAMARLNELRVG